MRVELSGGTFDVDPSDHIGRIMSSGNWYERDLLDDLRRRVTRGVAIDVGAHIGNHTVWMAAVCGLDVVALEPNPVALQALQRHVATNKLGAKVTVLPVAAGAAPATGELVPGPQGNTGMTRIQLGAGEVDVIPLDALELRNVAVIKIDVEGAQMGVLAGAERTIRRDRPVLYIETDDPGLIDAWLGRDWIRDGRFGRTDVWCWVPAVTVSVAVMAHPSRRREVAELVDQLDVAPQVVWDRHSDRWDTGRRAWLDGIDPRATHGMVLQDDVIACPDLHAGVQRMLATQPHIQLSPISLFIGRRRTKPIRWSVTPWVRQARRTRASFLRLPGPWWGQGVVMPAQHIAPAVAYGDRLTGIAHYDHRLALYWTERVGRRCLYTIPTLVNHRVAPSLLDHGAGPGRTSPAPQVGSALDVAWGGILTVHGAPPLPYGADERALCEVPDA